MTTLERRIEVAHHTSPAQYHDAIHIGLRVSYGAVALDRRVPGWEQHIRLEDLNIADAKRCVIGQVLGDYAAVFSVLGRNADEGTAFAHGFSGNAPDLPVDYMERLREAWIAFIIARRARKEGTK